MQQSPQTLFFIISPVDYKKLKLLDYPLVVKNPMDLTTLQKNVDENFYNTIEEFTNDLFLIWDNCKAYNIEGSSIYNMAVDLQQLSKNLINKAFKKKEKKDIKKKSNCLREIKENQIFLKENSKKNAPIAQEKNNAKENVEETENAEELASEDTQENAQENAEIEKKNEAYFKKKIQLNKIAKKMNLNQMLEMLKIIKKESKESIEIISERKFTVKLDRIPEATVEKLVDLFQNKINPY